MIHKFGKGARRDLPDERDLLAAPHLAKLPPIVWSTEFRLPAPPDEDQGVSNSCVAQSTSYYHYQLHPADYSRRDLYSRIFQPGGGAYLRDGPKQIVTAGQDTRDHMPDPQPETEMGMRDKSGQNPTAEAAHEELTYNSVAATPDAIAQSVFNFKGAIFGVSGSDEGWQDPMNPRPPVPGEAVWGHALYAMGYHMHNGLKCIIAKSSWCNNGVKEHHIRADYFATNNVFSAWTLIPKGTTSMDLINDNGTWKLVGDKGYIGISDPAALAKLQATTSESGAGPVTVPQVGVFKSVAIDKETSISVLGND